jgi:hypothetical protein
MAGWHVVKTEYLIYILKSRGNGALKIFHYKIQLWRQIDKNNCQFTVRFSEIISRSVPLCKTWNTWKEFMVAAGPLFQLI